jgi:hypothetical protein
MLSMLEAYEESYGLKWAYIVSGNYIILCLSR